MNKATDILNRVDVEIWDRETGIDLYDRDPDNIDMAITVYERSDSPNYYTMPIDLDTAMEMTGADQDTMFGFSEWNSALYFLTQVEAPREVRAFVKASIIVMFPELELEDVNLALVKELNELAKLEVQK